MTKTNAFRSKTTPADAPPPKPQKEGEKVAIPNVKDDTMFTEYRSMNHKPYLADYYELGDNWNDKLGGFTEEVELIEGYFKDKIEQGELKNETQAVKDELKKMYRLNKIAKSERTTMQIEKIAAYIKFLKDTDKISSTVTNIDNMAEQPGNKHTLQNLGNWSWDSSYRMNAVVPMTEDPTAGTISRAMPPNALNLKPFDYVSMALSAGDTTETYTFKSGGSGGTTTNTVVIVYTTSTRDVLSTVTKT